MNEYETIYHVLSRGIKGLEVYLKAGGDPNMASESNYSLLAECVSAGHINRVKLLLHYKANPSIYTSNGISPIYRAVERNDLAMTKLLIEAGASPHRRDGERHNAIFEGFRQNNLHCVRVLLEAKTELPVCKDVEQFAKIRAIVGRVPVIRYRVITFIGIARRHPYIRRDMSKLIGYYLWIAYFDAINFHSVL